MRFQKGQVLKVRDDLYTMGVDGVFNLWTDMCKFAGEEVVISDARETQWGDRYEIVGSPRCWTEECFVEIDKEIESNATGVNRGGYVVVVKDGWDNRFKAGEIYEVMEVEPNGDVYVVHPEGKQFNTGYAHLPHMRYSVLENYNPDKKVNSLANFTNREIIEELLRRFS